MKLNPAGKTSVNTMTNMWLNSIIFYLYDFIHGAREQNSAERPGMDIQWKWLINSFYFQKLHLYYTEGKNTFWNQ